MPTPSNVAEANPSRVDPPPTPQTMLWNIIKWRRIDFDKYRRYMDDVFCSPRVPERDDLAGFHQHIERSAGSLQRADAYEGVKLATEYFLRGQCTTLDDIRILDSDGTRVVAPASPSLSAPRVAGGEDAAVETTDGDTAERRASVDALEEFARVYLEELEIDGLERTVRVLPWAKQIRERMRHLVVRDCQTDSEWARYSSACVDAGRSYGLSGCRLTSPCFVELIWSFWMDLAMLDQGLKAILLRFQNRRSRHLRNHLENLALDPLRPLNNLLWGYIQDEAQQLSVARRAHQYAQQYGLELQGHAVGDLRPVESRTAFLETSHELYRRAIEFYREVDDLDRRADPFPLLNCLKHLEMELSQGAHNQYGDLPWFARREMMVMQWIFAHPQMREFLGGRVMVPYKEPWMDRVEAMNKLQGWPEGIQHFHELAVTSHDLILSVRYGNWSNVEDANVAYHWALAWRNEIQRYAHAYQACTGVDIRSDDLEARRAQPAELIRRRLTDASSR